MNIAQLKKVLFKQATIFETGGHQPTEELGESWIGKVMWGKEENIPSQYEPLSTIFLNNLPYVPEGLENIQLITIYMDFNVYDHLNDDNLAPFFIINCYTSFNGLQKINNQSARIKSFPLQPRLVKNDTPAWDSEDIETEVQDEILRLELEEDIEYYDDIVEDIYPMHKIGGYPTYTQSGVSYGEEYPFVFQISSDPKAQFNIVDSGSFYFFFNQRKQDWIVYCDFY
ncbi:MAG: DUF1963 domain-containing protein [Psychrobacillus sp.]